MASCVGLALGIGFLVPIWAAAAYENDDVTRFAFGFGYFLPLAVLVDVLVIIWTIAAYAMWPSYRSTPWTLVSALGVGGVLAGIVHAYLSLGALDIYEDSFLGLWFAIATALVIAGGLVLAASPRPPDARRTPSVPRPPPLRR